MAMMVKPGWSPLCGHCHVSSVVLVQKMPFSYSYSFRHEVFLVTVIVLVQ